MNPNRINNIITKCEIDNKIFDTPLKFLHHLKHLKISQKEYYDKYLKLETEGLCLNCKNEVKFKSIKRGYKRYCCYKCSSVHDEARKYKADQTKKAFLKKYGVDCPLKLPDYHKKSKLAKLSRYGDENYNNMDKNKKTCLEKYGSENFINSDMFKEKSKETCLKKYGVDHHTKSEEVKNKSKETCLEKYGVEYTLQSKEIRDKIDKTIDEKYGGYTLKSDILSKKAKDTMLDRYGVDNPLKNEDIKNKVKKTNLEKYGFESATKNKKVIEKTKETNLRKYGVDNTFNLLKVKDTFLSKYGVENASQIEGVKDKVKKTNLEKYGNESFFKTDYLKNKSKETCLEKYGCEYPMQNKEIYDKVMTRIHHRSFKLIKYKTIFGDELSYQSSSELEFVKFCEKNNIQILDGPQIPYYFNNKNRVYFSDFQIIENGINRIVEIKRKHKWWFSDLKSGMIKAKTKAAIKFSKENNYSHYKILFESKHI